VVFPLRGETVNTGAKIALAASGGYLLGRTKKLKMAVAFGLFLAGRKLPKNWVELVQQQIQGLSSNPQFAELSQQVTGNLMDAGKTAAGRSAERLLANVSERLRDGLPSDDSDQDDSGENDDEQDEADAGQDESDSDSAQDDSEQAQDDSVQDEDDAVQDEDDAVQDEDDAEQDEDDAEQDESDEDEDAASDQDDQADEQEDEEAQKPPAKKSSSARSKSSKSAASKSGASKSASSKSRSKPRSTEDV
jgi:hypothetical protein